MLDESDRLLLKNSLSFWDRLTIEQQNYMVENSSALCYQKGELLTKKDADCVGIIFLKKGELRTFMLSEEGRDVTLYRLYEGDFCVLSSSCVLNTITFEIQLSAEANCELLHISATCFQKIVNENIYVECALYKIATERFSDVMWTMQQILFTSFDKRLATFLLDESSKTKNDTISLTHEQIARYMGSAREVVSRMLKYFTSEGYVSLSRGGITLLDKKNLRKLLS